jgi:hypothetical protein
MRLVRGNILLGLIAAVLVASLSIAPVLARIPVEAWDEDKGYYHSYAWAYIYAVYDVRTGRYSGILHDHYYNWTNEHPEFEWKVELRDGNDPYHPYTETIVYYSPDDGYRWYVDSWASVIL